MSARLALVAALLLVAVAQFTTASQDDTAVWTEWKTKHNKVYETPEEEARRHNVFLDNKKRIDEHNAKFDKGEVTYFLGLNQFSDLTSEEFRQRHGHGVVSVPSDAQWNEWKATHNKKYESAAEEGRRYAVFLDNKKRIDEHNAKFDKGEVSYSQGLNAFSDLTNEEFKQRNGHGVRKTRAAVNADAILMQQWTEWKTTHKKVYETPEEEARRYAVFQDNKKHIDEHNAKYDKGEVTYSLGLNDFSDLTNEEFNKRHGHGVRKTRAVMNADAILIRDWAEWKAKHNKVYATPEEEAHRFTVFQDNKKLVEAHNAKFDKGEVTYSQGLNAFSDLTSEEFKKRNGHGLHKNKRQAAAGKTLKQQWDEWKAEHKKVYESPEEEARRYAVFQDNKKHIEEHNAKYDKGEVSYFLGLNDFSDLTNEEFNKRHGHGVRKTRAAMNADATLMQQWTEWKAKHNKVYATPEEEARRFAVFQDTKKNIDEHNAKFTKGEVTYSQGLNQFSDLTNEEFKKTYTPGLPREKRTVDAAVVQEWNEWKAKHNKTYATPEEEARRFTVFQDTKKNIDEHNAKFAKGEVSYSQGLNQFSDLTIEEYRKTYTPGLPRERRTVDAAVVQEWNEWKAKHNKTYATPEEEAHRFTVFQDTKKVIDEHNAKFAKGEVTYSMGLNLFSDLTNEEYRKTYTPGLPREKRTVDAAVVQQWTEWKAKHNKVYESPEEEARRFAVFQDNKKHIDEHNEKFSKGEVTYSTGLNAFSDLTAEEFKQRNGHGKKEDAAGKALKQQWDEWKAEHLKVYETAEEEARRFALFQDNKKRIDEHNEKFKKGEVSFSMGLNSFADLTSEEVKQRFGHGVLSRKDN